MFQLISPNMLKTYRQCPKKFWLKYVKNISMPVNDEIFEIGKNIHALASYYLRKEQIDKMEKTLSEREKSLWEYMKRLKYFSYEFINSEYTLNVKIKDYIFTGRLDALVKFDNCYYILDYKTDFIPKNATYDYQTMIYMLAIKEFFKTDNVKFVYIDLKNFTDVVIDLTFELEEEYKNELLEIANKLNKDELFFKTKNDDCNCEYALIC